MKTNVETILFLAIANAFRVVAYGQKIERGATPLPIIRQVSLNSSMVTLMTKLAKEDKYELINSLSCKVHYTQPLEVHRYL